VVSADEVQTVMKSLTMYPTMRKIKDIIAEVDTNGDGVIEFEEFVEMRRMHPNTELNVLAQFKKFDVSKLFRGYITEESVRSVLTEEGYEGEELEKYGINMMATDTDGDGKVTYKDLFERMMGRVPDEWLQWLYENVNRGVDDRTILKILLENGFSEEVGRELLIRTKTEGRLVVERTYVDDARGHIYHVRS
jgi:Ca2+-binding EF-hand superfamily protein